MVYDNAEWEHEDSNHCIYTRMGGVLHSCNFVHNNGFSQQFSFSVCTEFVWRDRQPTETHHHHHHHLSFNRADRWSTTDDFATSFLHSLLFPTALWDLTNSRLWSLCWCHWCCMSSSWSSRHWSPCRRLWRLCPDTRQICQFVFLSSIDVISKALEALEAEQSPISALLMKNILKRWDCLKINLLCLLSYIWRTA